MVTWATATSPRPLLHPKDAGDLRIMERLYESVTEYVLGIKGTMSGEHGDGLLRTPHISRMYGSELSDLFVEMKDAFDPQGLLNPGKKVGPQDDTGSLRRACATAPTTGRCPSGRCCLPARRVRARDRECHGCAQCKGAVTGTMCPCTEPPVESRPRPGPRPTCSVISSAGP